MIQLKKIGAGALAALTLGGALTAFATPAEAQRYRGGYYGGRGYYGHRGGIGVGGAVVAGLAGLAVGSAIAGNGRYYGGGYGGYYGAPGYYGAYGPGYAYGYGGPRCRVRYRWDGYYGRNVPVERCW